MYTVKYSEQYNQRASDYETRSLLYLLAMRNDSEKIALFFIDCINDVTGSSADCNELWDTQAKGVSSLNPSKIGEALFTLFENYISELSFSSSILILPKLKEGYLKDETLTQYTFDNFLDSKSEYVTNGLKNEFRNRNKITTLTQDEINSIDDFLNIVQFVVGENKEVYIREIIQFKNKDSLTTTFYSTIFDEIRDKQTALKNCNVEGVQINHPIELLKYKKYLKGDDIKLMVLNRLVGTELFKNSIPLSYYDEVQGLDSQDRIDLIQENNANISKTFFNKNNKKKFWLLLENILLAFNNNSESDIITIFNSIDPKLIRDNYTLDRNSILFFISLIKDNTNDIS